MPMQARTERGAAALVAISIKLKRRHLLNSYAGSLLFTATHLELAQGAIAEMNLDEASMWLANVFPGKERDFFAVVPFLIRACAFLWGHFRHESYGAQLLSWLSALCYRVSPGFYRMELWNAFVLSVTAVTAGIHGAASACQFLRCFSMHMPHLGTTVFLLKPRFLSQHDLVECKAFLHGGLAFHALVDVEAGVPLGLKEILFAAQGFASDNMWNYREQWVSLIDRAFRVGDVTEFKLGDHSQAAIELIFACLTVIHELEEHGQTGSAVYSTANVLWVHILRSLSFLGLVKALNHLVRHCNKESLAAFLFVGQSILSTIWHGEAPVTEDEETAYRELNLLLHGIYDSTQVYFEQDDRDAICFKLQLKVTSITVRFYMFVILTIIRGEQATLFCSETLVLLEGGARHSIQVLADEELDLAERWLLRLNEQGMAARPGDGFLAVELDDVLSMINLALALNHDPLGYEFGPE